MYFIWKFENFGELQVFRSSVFFAETSHMFSSYQCLQKSVRDFFKFCLDFELFAIIKKDLVSTHSFVTFLLRTQDLKKKKKNWKMSRTTFLDIVN